MKSLWSMLFLATILVISVKTSPAQTAQITGRITDSSGAVIQGAAVKVINVDNGMQREASSDVDGFYTVPLLQPGNYRITVEQPGFKTINRSGIKLTVDQEARIDLALEVGEVTEKVDVSEEAPLLESQTATVSTLVNNQQILEMPLNGRTFTSLLRLSPGAYTGSSGNLTSSPGQVRRTICAASLQRVFGNPDAWPVRLQWTIHPANRRGRFADGSGGFCSGCAQQYQPQHSGGNLWYAVSGTSPDLWMIRGVSTIA